MIEVLNHRRRWLWRLFVMALVLGGGLIAWRQRPLTENERKLLGSWEIESPYLRDTFAPDRTFVTRMGGPLRSFHSKARGEWRCSGDQVLVRFYDDPDKLLDRFRRLFLGNGGRPDPRGDWEPLRFDEDGHPWIGGTRHVRVRD